MLKRYLPLIVLLAAGFFLWYIKKNQRGAFPRQNTTTVRIPANIDEGFNRHASSIIYSRHARCRMECRHIDETEVREILQNGKLNANKIEEDDRGKTYPLEGLTHDNQHVRIVFAPKENNAIEVVTCIDLDNEWPCDCK